MCLPSIRSSQQSLTIVNQRRVFQMADDQDLAALLACERVVQDCQLNSPGALIWQSTSVGRPSVTSIWGAAIFVCDIARGGATGGSTVRKTIIFIYGRWWWIMRDSHQGPNHTKFTKLGWQNSQQNRSLKNIYKGKDALSKVSLLILQKVFQRSSWRTTISAKTEMFYIRLMWDTRIYLVHTFCFKTRWVYIFRWPFNNSSCTPFRKILDWHLCATTMASAP